MTCYQLHNLNFAATKQPSKFLFRLRLSSFEFLFVPRVCRLVLVGEVEVQGTKGAGEFVEAMGADSLGLQVHPLSTST